MPSAIPITCPRCTKSFSAELPPSEIINSERYSLTVANHPDPVICPDCNQKFTLAISEVRTGWVPIPDTNESLITVPNLRVVGRGGNSPVRRWQEFEGNSAGDLSLNRTIATALKEGGTLDNG